VLDDARPTVDVVRSLAGARVVHELVEGLNVHLVLAEPIPGGAVMRFEVRGTVKRTGATLRACNCMFATIVGGRITRIDEYIDPTFGTQLGV
jgi:hypothetical protein